MRVIMVLPYSSLAVGWNFKPDLYADGYHVRLAKELLKRSQEYKIECWRPEWKQKHEMNGEKDGISYRSFPSWRPSLGKFTKLFYKRIVTAYAPLRWSLWREYSVPLIKALRKECAKGDAIIVLFNMHFDLSYLICLACKDTPIIGYHIGGTPYRYSKGSFISGLPMSLLENKALSNVRALLITSESYFHSFERFYKNIPRIVYPMPWCVDFDLFKPMDKQESRKSLGIDSNKKVIIHVGRFDCGKGFDVMLDVLPELRKRYDLEFIAIGGTKEDMLYQRAIDNGVKAIEWLPHQELVKYYCASDVYVLPKFYTNHSDPDRFMATGVASEEALACGIPVVGTNLEGFFTDDELKGIGLIPRDKDDFIMCVEDILENPESYARCREIAVKYFSWTPMVNRLLNTFKEVAN